MQKQITKIITKYLKNAVLDGVFERDGALYIMVEVQSKIDDLLSNTVEKELMKELKIPIKLCFTQTQPEKKKATKVKKTIPGVKKVIMICSGKGGVGKSTISAYLAYYLQLSGYKVGLFDADIYGPSVQKIFSVDKELKIKDGNFIPHEKFGVKLMSMGFIVKSDDALVWRGPMVTKTLNQMLLQTDWQQRNLLIKSDLDYLIIDTPPGTGDVHLSLAENYEIHGAIVVSTPQALAIANAHRSVDMLEKLNVKLLGIIENMAYVIEKDGTRNYIFSEGNVKQYAYKMGLALLTSIPIIPAISDGEIVDNIKALFDDVMLCIR
jgi:ATP-binding protein involved in chromosome partitioning